MATSTLPAVRVPAVKPSDAELLDAVASLLAAMPGVFVQPRLSSLVGAVCSAYCAGQPTRRARLMELLAAYLQERHALPSARMTPAGVDEWVSHVRIDVVRCALIACARRLRNAAASGGEAR